jgi:hypothetical protein
MSKAVNAWTVYTNASKMYWGATAAQLGWGAGTFVATGGRATLGLTRAFQMASFGVRAHGNALRGVSRTSLLRGGKMTIGKASASIAAGYALGSAALLGIAQAGWGDSGFDDALDFVKDPFDWKKAETVGSALKETFWDSWSL